jgi:hypothetical protein
MISYNAGDLHPRKKPKQPSTQKQKTRLATPLPPAFRSKASKVAFKSPVNVAAHWLASGKGSVLINVNIDKADLKRKVFRVCVNQNPTAHNRQAG